MADTKKFFVIALILASCGLPALETDTSGLGKNLVADWIRQDFNILAANTYQAADVGNEFKRKLSAYCGTEHKGKPLVDCLAAAGMDCSGGICRYRGRAILTNTANGKVYGIEQKDYFLIVDVDKGINHLTCKVEVKPLSVTN